jgi:hypothetical protein
MRMHGSEFVMTEVQVHGRNWPTSTCFGYLRGWLLRNVTETSCLDEIWKTGPTGPESSASGCPVRRSHGLRRAAFEQLGWSYAVHTGTGMLQEKVHTGRLDA